MPRKPAKKPVRKSAEPKKKPVKPVVKEEEKPVVKPVAKPTDKKRTKPKPKPKAKKPAAEKPTEQKKEEEAVAEKKKEYVKKVDEELVEHIIVQEDLDGDPGLADEGIELGDKVMMKPDEIPSMANGNDGKAEVKEEKSEESENGAESAPEEEKVPEEADAAGKAVEDKPEADKEVLKTDYGKEDTVSIHNISPSRPITQVIGGQTWQIPPGMVVEFPKTVAEKMMADWPNAKLASDSIAIAKATETPWELGCGDAYLRARAAHGHKGFQSKDTTGPDRPKVMEPPKPKDGEGSPDTSSNIFVCPTCAGQFKKVVDCREHQRVEHGN